MTLKAAALHDYGQPMTVEEIDIDDPKPIEVQIRTHFAGINFSEIMARMGLYPGSPKPPGCLGNEFSGEIIEIGSEVKNFKVGDQVMGGAPFKSYSSHINVSEQLIMSVPKNFNMKQAAAFSVVYITAHMMIFDLGNLKKDEYFFIDAIPIFPV